MELNTNETRMYFNYKVLANLQTYLYCLSFNFTIYYHGLLVSHMA